MPPSNLRLMHLRSVEELRGAAADWDDLWWRSEAALPTARAELLAQWVEQFKPAGKPSRVGGRRRQSIGLPHCRWSPAVWAG